MIYNHRAHNADNEIICTTGLVRVYQGDHVTIWQHNGQFDEGKLAIILMENGELTNTVEYFDNLAGYTDRLRELYTEDRSKRYCVKFGKNTSYCRNGWTVPRNYFYNIQNIEKVIIPTKLEVNVNGFKECLNLKSIEGATFKRIYNGAFSRCDSLETLELTDELSLIDSNAFHECYGLKYISIPTSITIIYAQAFRYCENLESISFPDTLRTIRDLAFQGCIKLTDIVFSNSITSIGYQSFDNCNSLKSIDFQSGVVQLGESCFSSCELLESVNLGNATYIEGGAFMFCESLATIEIPNTVTYIGDGAFYGCRLLKKIIVHKPAGSISGAPWGATGAEVIWTG